MTSAQVVETSVSVTNNSPSWDYSHPDDQTTQTTETPGFKPFTMLMYMAHFVSYSRCFIFPHINGTDASSLASVSSGGYQGGMPQPQPYAPPPTGTTRIITQPGAVIVNMAFGESPISMVCPHCQTHIITCATYQDGTLTWLAAGALCLLG